MDNVETRLEQLERRLTVARRRAQAAWALGAGVLVVFAIQALLPAVEAQGAPGLEHRVTQLEQRVSDLEAQGSARDGRLDAVEDRASELEAQVNAQNARLTALEGLLVHVSREGSDLFITGANLHIVNGTGTTASTNGAGNLIVGYNEPRETVPDFRTGSHNVVVGSRHDFTAVGGLVVGDLNGIHGNYAAVSGGMVNTASGVGASVSGGFFNTATGNSAAISGGINNLATGQYASVTGGENNRATGGRGALVGGGNGNRAEGNWTSIAGGLNNRVAATAGGGAVSGGSDVTVHGLRGWAAGSEGTSIISGNFRSGS